MFSQLKSILCLLKIMEIIQLLKLFVDEERTGVWKQEWEGRKGEVRRGWNGE